jgi:hypothetical protein
MPKSHLLIALGLSLMLSGCTHPGTSENAESGPSDSRGGAPAAVVTSPTPSNGMDAARQAGPGWGHPNASGQTSEQHQGNSSIPSSSNN